MTLCVDPFKKFVSEKLKHFTTLSAFEKMSVRLLLLLKQEIVSYGLQFDLIDTDYGTIPCVIKVTDKSPAKLAGIHVN